MREAMAAAPDGRNPQAIIVAGPTASGKSALALDLARALGGAVINADSMQTYRELRVVTARPTPDEEQAVPHRLYGVRAAADPGSAAWWRQAALAEMAAAQAARLVPILCGGTGMYFNTLIEGLADIPDPGTEARNEARQMLAAIGPEALHARLAQADPATAARLRDSDGQRIARAWEVLRGTGQGLAAWHAAPALSPAPWRFTAALLDPPRDELRAAIASRFATMLERGALQEVRDFLALGLDPALPAMRAHGVPELRAYFDGACTLEQATQRACLVTTQYTKRQATWFRHHALGTGGMQKNFIALYSPNEQVSERFAAELKHFFADKT
jgi:tRNA dimethylallyltransferase